MFNRRIGLMAGLMGALGLHERGAPFEVTPTFLAPRWHEQGTRPKQRKIKGDRATHVGAARFCRAGRRGVGHVEGRWVPPGMIWQKHGGGGMFLRRRLHDEADGIFAAA